MMEDCNGTSTAREICKLLGTPFDITPDRSAFISDTFHRVLVEAARVWVIDSVLRTGELPETEVRFCYADGPHGFDWGNSPGPDSEHKPLRGKRVRVTFEIEDHH
tara:strand:- start:44 stop:358 length:315 start_codon:yes stop_codon:yes gene_type:complete